MTAETDDGNTLYGIAESLYASTEKKNGRET
jgi:hypothetical protein